MAIDGADTAAEQGPAAIDEPVSDTDEEDEEGNHSLQLALHFKHNLRKGTAAASMFCLACSDHHSACTVHAHS